MPINTDVDSAVTSLQSVITELDNTISEASLDRQHWYTDSSGNAYPHTAAQGPNKAQVHAAHSAAKLAGGFKQQVQAIIDELLLKRDTWHSANGYVQTRP